MYFIVLLSYILSINIFILVIFYYNLLYSAMSNDAVGMVLWKN